MGVQARVLADSYYAPVWRRDADGTEHRRPYEEVMRDWPWNRVTTLEVVIHRFVLAEFNTHRRFSRNSASSRAIPFPKMLERVLEDPAIPLSFPSEQKGMQGGEEIHGGSREIVERHWYRARDSAVQQAETLHAMGVHKSVVNRLLEPFMWHTIIVTANEWENFFAQRCSPLAQPEIRAAAEAMRDAIAGSTPELLEEGQWHRPLFDDEKDSFDVHGRAFSDEDATNLANQVSAARCGRVSYLTHEGTRDVTEDIALFQRLASADPPHWSPLEHVCRPQHEHERGMVVPGNLAPFVQLRHIVSGEHRG